MLRAIPVAAAAAVLAGCGGEQNNASSTTEELRPPPPIEVVDEPFPAGVDSPGPFGSHSGCATVTSPPWGDGVARSCTAAEAREIEAPLPAASGASPRVLAELRLSGAASRAGDTALFVGFRSRGYGVCFDVVAAHKDGLLCSDDVRSCADICLRVFVFPDPDVDLRVLGGVVARRADSLRIFFANERVARYPLVGPVVSDFANRRVFLLELAPQAEITAVELLAGEEVMAARPFRPWES